MLNLKREMGAKVSPRDTFLQKRHQKKWLYCSVTTNHHMHTLLVPVSRCGLIEWHVVLHQIPVVIEVEHREVATSLLIKLNIWEGRVGREQGEGGGGGRGGKGKRRVWW